jgi:hypothetical protein
MRGKVLKIATRFKIKMFELYDVGYSGGIKILTWSKVYNIYIHLHTIYNTLNSIMINSLK